MNFSLSTSHWRTSEPQFHGATLTNGMPRNTRVPEQALKRGRSLATHGRYEEARAVILPHVRSAPSGLRVAIHELLARCAMAGVGGDWESLLRLALGEHTAKGDNLGKARMRRDLGSMLATAGRFDEAEAELRAAAAGFAELRDAARAGLTESLRARLRAQAGFVTRAHRRISRAIQILSRTQNARSLAIARLELARILAMECETAGVARELIAAEAALSASVAIRDRIRARLVAAECYHILGDPERARAGTRRLLTDVSSLEEVSIQAWVHALFGEASSSHSPGAARKHLARARRLFGELGRTYDVTRCDIALSTVEFRLGLDAHRRLDSISAESLRRRPLLTAEYAIARATVSAETQPKPSRRALEKAQTFAADNDHHALTRRIAAVLEATGLGDRAPTATRDSARPWVVTGSSTTTVPGVPVPAVRQASWEPHTSAFLTSLALSRPGLSSVGN